MKNIIKFLLIFIGSICVKSLLIYMKTHMCQISSSGS